MKTGNYEKAFPPTCKLKLLVIMKLYFVLWKFLILKIFLDITDSFCFDSGSVKNMTLFLACVSINK